MVRREDDRWMQNQELRSGEETARKGWMDEMEEFEGMEVRSAEKREEWRCSEEDFLLAGRVIQQD